MRSRPERVIGHTGTETRPRLLREAAVGNLPQWTKYGATPVSDEGSIVKLFVREEQVPLIGRYLDGT